jgi:hypothetical protein
VSSFKITMVWRCCGVLKRLWPAYGTIGSSLWILKIAMGLQGGGSGQFIEQLACRSDERLRQAETPAEDTLCCPRPIGPS